MCTIFLSFNSLTDREKKSCTAAHACQHQHQVSFHDRSESWYKDAWIFSSRFPSITSSPSVFSFFWLFLHFFLSFSIRTSHFSIPQGNALSPLPILSSVSLVLFWALTNHSFSEIPYKEPISVRNSWDETSMSKWAMNCAGGGHNVRKVLVSLCWGSFSGGERRQLHWNKELKKVDSVLAVSLLWWPHSVHITN